MGAKKARSQKPLEISLEGKEHIARSKELEEFHMMAQGFP